MTGIRWFANVVDAMTPALWRTWFQGLSPVQLRSLAGPLEDGRDAVGLCPACGYTWPAYVDVPLLVCPHCEARIKARDSAPRPLGQVALQTDLGPVTVEDLVTASEPPPGEPDQVELEGPTP